jgi:hypothetical protein
MSTIYFACPLCSKRLKSSSETIGLKMKCGACGESFLVPLPEAVPVVQPHKASEPADVNIAQNSPVLNYRGAMLRYMVVATIGAVVAVGCFLAGLAMGISIGKKPGNDRPVIAVARDLPPQNVALPPQAVDPPRKPEIQAPAEPPISTTAENLWRIFVADAVVAGAYYRDKSIVLTGVTGKVDRDQNGVFIGAANLRTEVASRSTQPMYMSPLDVRRRAQNAALSPIKYVPGVLLFAKHDKSDQFAAFYSARFFSIKGFCRGTRGDDRGEPGFVVIVDGCEIVE